jgi:hypothetical protein
MLYAAGALNDANPWWPVMPELARYLQRLSFLLRQGEPVADVALYAPAEDAYASFRPGDPIYLNLWKAVRERIGPDVIPAILDAGYSYDLIDDGTLEEAGERGYKAIVLANARYVPEETRRWLTRFQAAGGTVLAVGTVGEESPPGVKAIGIADLARGLEAVVPPDVTLTPPSADIGFVHRALPDADVYFLANTGNRHRTVTAKFRTSLAAPELWDPLTGRSDALDAEDGQVALEIEPYAARVVVFRHGGRRPAPPEAASRTAREALASGWRVAWGDRDSGETVELPHDGSREPATRHLSGAVTYTRELEVSFEGAGTRRAWLDFGEPVETTREALASGTIRGKSYAALLEPPVREAASVWVNGEPAGHLWAPPYRIELTGLLRDGANELRIEVYNSAINGMAEGGRLPDMAALVDRYGQRARLQDLDDLAPLPFGILAVPELIIER